MRSTARSPYMEFAKLRTESRYNLATSGMPSYPLRDLRIWIDELEINGSNSYGYAPLKEAIAKRYGVGSECVVTAAGTSFANYLALAALTDPGDEIVIEQPTYELILSTAKYLGLRIKRFRRDPSDFSIDLNDLQKQVTWKTKAIVLCDFHNPSGHFADDDTLRAIGVIAKKAGAKVIVDEVYREMLWEEHPRSAVHLDPAVFISTSSLTKAYGLSGIRCGWILAPAELAQHMWRINDLHAATSVYPAELIAVRAFERLDTIAADQRRLLDLNRVMLRAFLDTRRDLDCYWPEHGTVVFPRLRQGDVDDFAAYFHDKFEGSVVPGRFFEMPDHLRIGIGIKTEQAGAALEQLGRALDSFRVSYPAARVARSGSDRRS